MARRVFSKTELQDRLRDLAGTLTQIAEGSVITKRCEAYQQGGTSRRCLDMDTAFLSVLADGQEDVVMDTLLKMFPALALKNLDFILRVLLPEAIHHMYPQATSEPEADQDDTPNIDTNREMGIADDGGTVEAGGRGVAEDGGTVAAADRGVDQASNTDRERDDDDVTGAVALKGTDRSRNRKRHVPAAKRVRVRVPCPIQGCRGCVVNLPRHLLHLHKDIPPHDRVKLLDPKPNINRKRKLKSWTCPEDGCGWKGDRLDKHLMSKTHAFDPGVANAMAKLVRDK